MRKYGKEIKAWLGGRSLEYFGVSSNMWLCWNKDSLLSPMTDPHLKWRVKEKAIDVECGEYLAKLSSVISVLEREYLENAFKDGWECCVEYYGVKESH